MMLIKKSVWVAGCMLVAGAAYSAEYTVGQQDKTFVMNGAKAAKLQLKVGDQVHFKNQDPFFHNVFSLSDIKTFDLGSFPQNQFKTVVFDKPGAGEVECAIHPQMLLEVEVK